MSNGAILGLILLGFAFVIFGVPLLIVFFDKIIIFIISVPEAIADGLKYPFRAYKYNKQMNCFHHWRRLDGEYGASEPIYRYRCIKCKSEKKLRKTESMQFEKDFMSDWY